MYYPWLCPWMGAYSCRQVIGTYIKIGDLSQTCCDINVLSMGACFCCIGACPGVCSWGLPANPGSRDHMNFEGCQARKSPETEAAVYARQHPEICRCAGTFSESFSAHSTSVGGLCAPVPYVLSAATALFLRWLLLLLLHKRCGDACCAYTLDPVRRPRVNRSVFADGRAPPVCYGRPHSSDGDAVAFWSRSPDHRSNAPHAARMAAHSLPPIVFVGSTSKLNIIQIISAAPKSAAAAAAV